MRLKSILGIEILTVIDNYSDVFLPRSAEVKRRPLFTKDRLSAPVLAEHGLSLFITVHDGANKRSLLFDAGYTEIGCIYNLDVLGVPVKSSEAFVLSHGHFDHTGALYDLFRKGCLKPGTPVHLHSKAFSERGLKDSEGNIYKMPRLSGSLLEEVGAKVVVEDGPSLILDGACLITGEIPRKSFEIGFPIGWRKEDGKIIRDDIPDDQALIFHLQGKGLVIVLGCGHSGVINTINYAIELTDTKEIYAVIGGFHLSGPIFEKYTDRTIDELLTINPKLVVPTHCTGFNSIKRFAERMPDSFVLNSVGTKYCVFS